MNTQFKNYVKEFDTVVFTCQYLDDKNKPTDLTDITIKANMQSLSGRLVDTLDVIIDDAVNGIFILKPTIDRLPIGTHSIDILFEKNGSRVSSDTFGITVVKAITTP